MVPGTGPGAEEREQVGSDQQDPSPALWFTVFGESMNLCLQQHVMRGANLSRRSSSLEAMTETHSGGSI